MGYGNCGKLGKKTTAPSFPQFPQPLLLSLLGEENRMYAAKLVQNRMDKKESGA
jgi:hypothetical protein